MGYMLLTRPRLVRRLRQAVHVGHAMISAPPGYGKSTLLHTFAADQPNTHYLLLTPADLDLGYLQARVQPLMTAGATLLLDDLHHLHEADAVLTWLAAQLRVVKSHFVLSGRQIPGPLWTLLLSQSATHLTVTDLAFTPAESKALLSQQAQERDEQVTHWHRQTQGWPLAVALLTQQQSLDLQTFTQADNTLFDYLAETVMATLPPPLVHFMQLTALPLRVNDELAAHLLAVDVAQAAAWRAEVQRRNLFLSPTDLPGWRHYHDLIRTFLHQRLAHQADLTASYQKIVAWFIDQQDLPMAIEHALLAGLYEQAAELLMTLPRAFVWRHARHHTLHRWITSLPATIQERYPLLLSRLGRELLYVGWRTEAWRYLQMGLTLAAAHPDPMIKQETQLALASGHYHDGQPLATIAICQEVLATLAPQTRLRRWSANLLAGALAQMSRFREARRAHEMALALPEDNYTRSDPVIRTNLVAVTLTPLGEFAVAERLLQNDAAYFADKPGERIAYLLAWSGLYEGMGDWDNLSTTLQAIVQAEAAAEARDSDDMWQLWWQALLAIGRSHFMTAATYLDKATTMIGDDAERAICVAWARVWQLRRQQDLIAAVDLACTTLAQPWPIPYYRGLLALEAAIAHYCAHLQASPAASASPLAAELVCELGNILHLRARSPLLRLRALLAVACYQRGDWRWRRHLNAVLRNSQGYGYEKLLIQRDPDLGGHVWSLCVVEGIARETAIAALQTMGTIVPLTWLLLAAPSTLPCPLQQQPCEEWVIRVSQALAALGQEEAIPVLLTRLEQTQTPAVQAALEAAIAQLETAPPPKLEISLLGDFQVVRGGRSLPDSAWQRPAARRLFQYFALHRGRPRTRDQILDALWPESDPQQARTSFRTLYSWVRKALEPYLRPKSPSRYFSVEGDLYTFDPQRNPHLVSLDSEAFEATLRPFLVEIETADLPQPTPALLASLTAWQPLLPEAAYESWVLAPRERLHDCYVQGCLAVAQALLAVDRSSEAAAWAEKAISAAPWLEEGYQALMRAQARQGQRTVALKTYAACVTALKRELDVPPSARTEWLAQRLRADEAI